MRGERRLSSAGLTALVAVALLAAITTTEAFGTSLKYRACGVSPELTTLGIRCAPAKRIATKAIDKSNCPYDPHFRGCNRTVRVRGWTCKGLFPGEGWSFTCRKATRRIHYSGGG